MEEGEEKGSLNRMGGGEKTSEGTSAWKNNPEGLAGRLRRQEEERRRQEMANRSYASILQRRSNRAVPVEIPTEVNNGKVCIKVPKEIIERNTKLWEHGLVGRFTGPRPDLERIRAWAALRWKTTKLEIAALPRGCVLFNFQSQEEMLGVLLKAPWYMDGKGLLLEKWHIDFNPKDEDPKMVPIWVQVPGLPLQCWDEDIIRGIAGAIGELLTIDSATTNKTRLIHARFCVLVKTDAPIPTQLELEIGGRVWDLELIYEAEKIRCSKCKGGGHLPQNCKGKVATEIKEGPKKKWIPKERKEEEKQGEEPAEKVGGAEEVASQELPQEPHQEVPGIEEVKEETQGMEKGSHEEPKEAVEQKEAEEGQGEETTQEEQEAKEEPAAEEESSEGFERVQTRRGRRRMDLGSEERRVGRPSDKERRERETANQIDMGVQKTLDNTRGKTKGKK